MAFRSARFFQLRNLSDQEVSLDGEEIFLIGENGQGKTNFLEGLYLLCYGSSFRTHQEKVFIRRGKEEFSAIGNYEKDQLNHQVKLKIQKGKKSITVDEKQLRDRKELIWNLPCIVFSHDDIFFVSGTPDMRRHFFDQTLSLYNPNYIDTLRKYRKILKNRNSLLKEGERKLIQVLDLQLAVYGLELVAHREKLIVEFNHVFTEIYGTVSQMNSPLKIQYRPSWKTKNTETVLNSLASRYNQERIMGITYTGPHRDHYRFLMKGEDFSQIASTGQTRLISLVLRVAQGEFFKRKRGRKPILLLDDVLLELDFERRERFLGQLPEYEQAFFTFLPDEKNLGYRKSKTLVYQVKEGVLSKYER